LVNDPEEDGMRKRLAWVALATTALAGPRPVHADVWDTTGDDAGGTTRNELIHGTDQVHDLAGRPGPVADLDWYRVSQQRYSSYEIVVDAASGDLGPSGPALDRIAADGATVLQSSVPAGAAKSRTLRFENATAGVVNDQRIRVLSNGCGSGCGSEATYRIRSLDTTCSIPRFNNSGTQITLVVVQNTGSAAVDGHMTFWSGLGVLLLSQPFTVAGHASAVFNSSTVLPGSNGSVTVSHTGAYGQLVGRATSVEPATGFTFDTPMVPRPMPAQGSAGGRGSAALVLDPASADYGAVFVGGSHSVTFTVRNIGALSSGVLATGLSGPDAGQFNISANTCAGAVLTAGTSCSLQGHFAPSSGGPKAAVLSVGGTPGGTVTASLAGNAINANPVFATSTTVTGGIGGFPAADAICQARAAAGGLPPGNYVAWLSTFAVDAVSRLGSARGFVRTDGKPFTDDTNPGLIINQAVLNSIRTDENGAVLTGNDVWTGTLNTGGAAPNTCADWTNGTNGVTGTAGNAEGGPVSWTLYSFPVCSTPAHLYCFRTDLNAPLSIPPNPGRFAFITNTTWMPGGGLAAADALCASEQGGLPGTYRAYLATTTATAASRVNLAASQYVRIDLQSVGGAAELGNFASLESGVWQWVNGAYVNGTILPNRATWTGAASPASIGTAATTCDDWTSTAGTGYQGDPTLASPSWFGNLAGQSCTQARRIYCLQQ
jgi:hypothetical protein